MRYAEAQVVPPLAAGSVTFGAATSMRSKVLPDEQQGTAIGFLSRALPWFNGQGVECAQVMSDNGSACISCRFAKACKVLGLKHIRTRPDTPRTNGKAERFIQNPQQRLDELLC